MAYLEEGDTFQDFVGPLGCPSDLIEEDIEELKKRKSYLSQVDLVPLRYIRRLSGFMSMALMQMSSWDQEPRICFSISMR